MERSPELEEFAKRYAQAARDGYGVAAADFVSERAEVVVIGSDPDEWWDGAGYNRAMRAQADAMGGSIPIYLTDMQAYREGSVGWIVGRPVFRFGEGQEAESRLTAVVHDEGGRWKIVHLHLSVGVPNEDVLGQELPT
jgi:hypothetical protein